MGAGAGVEPAEALAQRLAELRESHAYRCYERARAAVLAMKARGSGDVPSAYWREELVNIEYLLDASPLVVERLRQHCFHVTGVWPYRYRSHNERQEKFHERRLDALAELGGRDLLVPEPELLGGFGFEIDGALVNLDTLKFFEVLIALRLAGLLDLLESDGRAVVWEIGAGWGGFAYQVKTLFPHVTYVVSDLPELFVFSGTYLGAAFPEARLAYHREGEEIDWSADFVFVPNTALDAVTPPRIDLVLNMVSFQEMTTEQVAAYVDHAAAIGARHLYSLNRDRSPYNPELDSVAKVLRRRYDVRKLELLRVGYARINEDPRLNPPLYKRLFRRVHRHARDYEHLVGTLR